MSQSLLLLNKLIAIAYLVGRAFGGAYEINLHGQTFQVNVINPDGGTFSDRSKFTDDHGDPLDTQPKAVCSSLRTDYCPQITDHNAKRHNLFNYFPSRETESVLAHANRRFTKNPPPPHTHRQPLDERISKFLSKQNPHNLGTKPTRSQPNGHGHGVAQNLVEQMAMGANNNFQRIGTFKRKAKPRKPTSKDTNKAKDNNGDADTSAETDAAAVELQNESEQEFEEVEIEFFANVGDEDLATALGLNEEEFGETVDRIVAQLMSSYVDNDSDEVDVPQIFTNEISAENGEIVLDEIVLDEASLQQINELLNAMADKKNGRASEGGGDDMTDEEAQMAALGFMFEMENEFESDYDSVEHDYDDEESDDTNGAQ